MTKQQTHVIERTSPEGPGERFVGYCRLCGKAGLTLDDMDEPCENTRDLTAEEALLEAVDPPEDKSND